MGLGILIPVAVLAIAIPFAFSWARTRFKSVPDVGAEPVSAPSQRLTSNALRGITSPPWRVVYEIASDKLGGVEHVLLGPGGIYAMTTSMDPLPAGPGDPDPHAVGRAAVVRGALDDALRRCAMASDRLVTVHWGVVPDATSPSVEVLPGVTAVDGRQVATWVASLGAQRLSPAQVDLAWQTVLTALGRPDPLR